MTTIKTYQSIDATANHKSFSISKMETIYTKRQGAADIPHRHNYFTVVIVKEAKGTHNIDFNTYPLRRNQLFFIAPGQVHQIIEDLQSFGYALTFSTQFLIENQIPLNFLENLNLFNTYGESPPLEPNTKQFNKILEYVDTIYGLFHSNEPMKDLSIGAFLKLILIQANTLCTLHPEDVTVGQEYRIIKEFKNLVNTHYTKEHSTSFYAKQLHISSDHLNRTVKNTIGKTAKDYIQSKIITEAKRLLFFSNLSQKKIGYQLGFSEPANFSAFFKKCTGASPSNFLKNVRPSSY